MQMLVNIDVPDLEAAIDFYTRALGLNLERRLFGGSVAELSGASAPLYLLSKAEGSAPATTTRERRAYRRHWTPVHLDFVVADLDSALAQALAAGARCEELPQDLAYGRLAMLSDPFGHGFCLLQWSRRGYAEVP